ncbi:MAG: sialate O-acetylesterase [Planctomycetota bacterium]|nr:sialate O-acetylesterase [Planctomycetota bacterium]
MRANLLLRTWSALVVLLCLVPATLADVKLPGVFGEHMVLQREVPVPVWGWAEAGEKVTVTLGEQSQTATADSAGKWSVKLAALQAGAPRTLKVQGQNTLEFSDVLVGEVWLCSGQSNMAMAVNGVRNKEAELAAADLPQIRMLTVARKTAEEPQENCEGTWQVCSPQTVGGFSATAYFFGRELHQQLKVPVGLINSSWGGTPIQGWTSLQAHAAVPELAPLVDGLKKAIDGYDPEAAKQRYEKQLAKWQEDLDKAQDKTARDAANRRKPRLQESPRLAPGSLGRLFNGMLAPLAPYAIRGAIWYQGEANAGGAKLYGLQLRTMITEWRTLWKQGDFPFLSVQLPNFMKAQEKPSEMGGWPLIREQFLQTLSLKNTGLAVTIDVGEADDIHPKNKQAVGQRLAQWALAKTYGKEVVACGPLVKSSQCEGGQITVAFDCVGGGLAARDGGQLKGFAIAGEDKQFVWAEAKVVGQTVVVSSPEVKAPAAVRYAWANNPDCNLINQAGLPASPFRTDDWAD